MKSYFIRFRNILNYFFLFVTRALTNLDELKVTISVNALFESILGIIVWHSTCTE